MKHIRKIAGLMLSLTAALSLTVPAFASDYSFTTDAPQDRPGDWHEFDPSEEKEEIT